MIDDCPWITVQVLPLSAADHPLPDGSLELFRFGDGLADIVHQPTVIGGGIYVDDENDTEECFRAYDRLRAAALGPAESLDFVETCRRKHSP